MEISEIGRQKLTKKIAELKEQLEISKKESNINASDTGNRFGYDSSLYAEGVRQNELREHIKELEDILATSTIVDTFAGDDNAVKLTSIVSVKLYYENEEAIEDVFYIKETDVDEIPDGTRAITFKSPIGAAIYGKVAGDVVVAKIPNGSVRIEIVDVVNSNVRR